MDAEQIAVTIRDAIRDIPRKYEMNADEIKRLEDERNDLEHYIELKKLNAGEGYKAYRELHEVLTQRRVLKDENEELKHIYPALKSLKSQLSQFDKAIGDIRKTKAYLKRRTYRCRIRKDLEKEINAVKL